MGLRPLTRAGGHTPAPREGHHAPRPPCIVRMRRALRAMPQRSAQFFITPRETSPSTTALFRRQSNENPAHDILRHDVILFGVEPLTKRSQGEALLSAAPLAPREKSEIFPAGAPGEITKCRTEGIAIATRSVNRVGQTYSASAMRHLIAPRAHCKRHNMAAP